MSQARAPESDIGINGHIGWHRAGDCGKKSAGNK